MKYITDKELEEEIKQPLVKDSDMGSIDKFIPNYWQDKNDYHNKNKWHVEPTRPLVTKFYDYESTTNLN